MLKHFRVRFFASAFAQSFPKIANLSNHDVACFLRLLSKRGLNVYSRILEESQHCP